MTSSVESRVPFLPRSFVASLLSSPVEHVVSPNDERKQVSSEAMRGLLSAAIRTRQDGGCTRAHLNGFSVGRYNEANQLCRIFVFAIWHQQVHSL